MRRSRAFILSEILMTMMLQAGFILVLCTSFYMLTSFYSKTQQVLTARSHAERVISFVDNKIRHAGLGMWACTTPSDIREALGSTATGEQSKIKNFRLPVAVRQMKANAPDDTSENTPIDIEIGDEHYKKYYGNILTLYYAQKDMSSNGNEIVMIFCNTPTPAKIRLIDVSNENKTLFQDSSLFTAKNPVRWSVAESIGRPFYISESAINYPNINLSFYGTGGTDVTIPRGGELMYLHCMQMYAHTDPTEKNRQFAFRELNPDGRSWTAINGFNQEENILETYMELDTSTNIFTLYVLAQGGYDAAADNPQPKAWPDNANWEDDYKHYTVYVSRASWKLNNIPPNFSWD